MESCSGTSGNFRGGVQVPICGLWDTMCDLVRGNFIVRRLWTLNTKPVGYLAVYACQGDTFWRRVVEANYVISVELKS